MTPEQWHRVGRIYRAALALEPDERTAFLRQACSQDDDLRREVESLLAAEQHAGDFLEDGALNDVARIMVKDLSSGSVPTGLDLTPIPAGTLIDRYEILSALGAGGMGQVYLALDTRLKRKVALKVLPPEFTQDEDRVHRFELEALAASALNHPNILTIYEIGHAEDVPFIATEYIEGQTLRQKLRAGVLALPEAIDIGLQAASALDAAHQAGILHRDIKPENIMLRHDGYVKVLDFGLAKLTERQDLDTDATTSVHTEPGIVQGTVQYMSPEQARALAVDARTDIFSLGDVLYEMVTGRAPFAGATTGDVIAAIIDKEPAPLTRYVPDVPAELERILRKALAKACGERYQTARDLLIDLKGVRQELEIRTKEPTVDTRKVAAAGLRSSDRSLVSEIKRHRGSLLILAVLVVALAQIIYWTLGGKADQSIDSIAVLPFVNASASPDSDYLSDGIAEGLINNLSQLPRLRVVPRSTVFRYKGQPIEPQEVGRKLGVRAVLTGRVQQRGDMVNIQAELMDVAHEAQLWGEQYDRKLADLQVVQGDIAKEISDKLRLKLSAAEQSSVTRRYTENAEAYQLYLKGRFYWNKRSEEGLLKGIEYFKQAVEKDPSYALAYTGLADCYSLLAVSIDVGSLSPSETMPKAKAAAKKAIEMDDTLAEAHTSLAFIRLIYDWEWSGADAEFKRAIALNPNYSNAHHWYSHYFMAMGRIEDSLGESKRALELDPLSLIMNVHLGWHYLHAHQYDAAIEQFKKTLEMDHAYGLTHWYLGVAYEQKAMYEESARDKQRAMYEEAVTELQKAKDLHKGNVLLEADLGHAYAVLGKRYEAQKLINELKELSKRRYVSSYHTALIYMGLGDNGPALEWLQSADKERSDLVVYVKTDPRLDSLRSDQRFKDLLLRIGLPQ